MSRSMMITATTSRSVASAGSFRGTSLYWTAERGLEKSTSVIHSLFSRELGNQFFYRNGDSSVVVVARQLLNSRAVSDDISEKAVKAVKVELTQRDDSCDETRNQNTWIQIGVPEKTEIGITDTRIWTRTKFGIGRGSANKKSREMFYSVESTSSPSFKCLNKLYSTAAGRIKKTFVVAGRVLTDERLTTHFLTLMEPGILRAYDLVKNKVTDELRLPTSISQGVTGFTEMDVFDNNREIFIMGTATAKKLTKVIIVMNYAPWKEMSLIHVEVPFFLELQEGVCFLFRGKFLQITTWPLIMKKVTKDLQSSLSESDISSRSGLPAIKFEGRLNVMPEILTSIRLNSEYIGLLSTNSVPMFFGILKSGLNFFTFHKNPVSIYEHRTDFEESTDPSNVLPFPDGSSKALIWAHFSNQSQFIEFSSTWNDEKGEKIVNVSMLDNAFNYWKDSHSVTPSAVSGNVRRQRMHASNNITNPLTTNKPTILGLQYGAVMYLIAVLTADEEQFQVAIYEPLKLKMVKALPPVYAWTRKNGDVNKKRESIGSVEFIFETEFIFVSFNYSCGCKPQREVFMIHLLSEKH